MAIRTTEEVKKIVREYYTLLMKAGLPLEKVILFGSFSRGEQTEYSDIDIAVVLREYAIDKFNTRLELMKYSRGFDEVIEPHPFLSTDFDDSNPFAAEILESDVKIYS